MNRRGFLKIAFAAGAASAVPILFADALASKNIIYADGIHDDTEALQAAIDGEDFACASDVVRIENGLLRITGGKSLTSNTIYLRKTSRESLITDCWFDFHTSEHGDCSFVMEPGSRTLITHSTFNYICPGDNLNVMGSDYLDPLAYPSASAWKDMKFTDHFYSGEKTS